MNHAEACFACCIPLFSCRQLSAEGVERLDPKTRQFSDLPKWVDDNVDRLRYLEGEGVRWLQVVAHPPLPQI